MNPLYNLGVRLFGAGLRVAALRGGKVARLSAGQAASFGKLKKLIKPGARYVWVHAASLGEFEQGRPLIERIRREHPELKILLSFFSPSGYEVRKNYEGADIVVYLPIDTPANARRWVEMVKPVAAIFVKYEFWGNYLQQLHKAGVPVYLISSIFRPKQIFFRPWGGMFRGMLRCYTHLFVQDEASRRLLENIGVDNVTVAGDTRFDRVTDIMRDTHDVESLKGFTDGAPLTMVFGSSWPADEQMYMPWLAAHPEVKAIVAPHEFDEARIERLRKQLGEGTVLMSELTDGSARAENARHVIVDCFGLLSSLYRYGDAAYVGGGFGTGIHNINEAAVYGIPVAFGPRHGKFKEATDLITCGGAFEVTDAESVDRVFGRMLTDADWRKEAGQKAGQYISDNLGATSKIYSSIFST